MALRPMTYLYRRLGRPVSDRFPRRRAPLGALHRRRHASACSASTTRAARPSTSPCSRSALVLTESRSSSVLARSRKAPCTDRRPGSGRARRARRPPEPGRAAVGMPLQLAAAATCRSRSASRSSRSALAGDRDPRPELARRSSPCSLGSLVATGYAAMLHYLAVEARDAAACCSTSTRRSRRAPSADFSAVPLRVAPADRAAADQPGHRARRRRAHLGRRRRLQPRPRRAGRARGGDDDLARAHPAAVEVDPAPDRRPRARGRARSTAGDYRPPSR